MALGDKRRARKERVAAGKIIRRHGISEVARCYRRDVGENILAACYDDTGATCVPVRSEGAAVDPDTLPLIETLTIVASEEFGDDIRIGA